MKLRLSKSILTRAPASPAERHRASHATVGTVPVADRQEKGNILFVNFGRIVFGLVAVAMWQIAVELHWIDPFIFSRPSTMFSYLVFDALPSRALWIDTYYTLLASFLAFVLGSILGVVAGLLLVRFPTMESIVRPYVTLLNSLPRVALAPLFIVWFGIGVTSKVVVGVTLVFFILLINTIAGAASVDRDLLRLCRVLGADSWTVFRRITLPTAVPSIFAGLKLGLVYAVLGVIVGEMVASEHGLGQKVVYYSNVFQMGSVLALLLFLALITTTLSLFMHFLERHLLRWQR